MNIVVLASFLLIYVTPGLQASRSGKETCYYVVKVKETRLDCSPKRRSVDFVRSSQTIRGRRRGRSPWGEGWPWPATSTTSTPTTPTPTLNCKPVTKKKTIEIPIYERPVDPVVARFTSPDFPKIKLKKKKLKCEWDVVGLKKKKYWVNVMKQFLSPNSSDTANCLWIRSKGTMCAGKVVPVLTANNKLLMRMTLDSGQFDDIQGGLHGFYVEYDPTAPGGALPLASGKEYKCGEKTCTELSCNSTDSGPDTQLQEIVEPKATVQSRDNITVNATTPTPSQSSPTRTKTEPPAYRKNNDFIAGLFDKLKLPVDKPNKPKPTQPKARSTPTPTPTSSCIPTERYDDDENDEDDRCDQDPPDAARANEENTYERYFHDEGNGECQPILVTDPTLKGNIFENETECQKTCMNICLLPKDSGYGDTSETNFYFHAIDRDCRLFQYKGNGGNANRFETRNECEIRCLAPIPDQFAMEALMKIFNNEASTDEYEDEKKVKCLLPHLRNSESETTVCTTPAPDES